MLTAATCGKRSSSEDTKLQYAVREDRPTGAAFAGPKTLRRTFCEPAFRSAAATRGGVGGGGLRASGLPALGHPVVAEPEVVRGRGDSRPPLDRVLVDPDDETARGERRRWRRCHRDEREAENEKPPLSRFEIHLFPRLSPRAPTTRDSIHRNREGVRA